MWREAKCSKNSKNTTVINIVREMRIYYNHEIQTEYDFKVKFKTLKKNFK